MTGPGHLTLSGANTFIRALRVEGGTLRITTATALGATGAGNETILAGGDLLLELGSPDPIGETLVFANPDQVSALASCEWPDRFRSSRPPPSSGSRRMP